MRILTNNKATTTNTTINNENSAFPKDNMYGNILVEKTSFDRNIDVDFGTTTTSTAVGLVKSDDNVYYLEYDNDLFAPTDVTVLEDTVTFIDKSASEARLGLVGPASDYSSATEGFMSSPDDQYDTVNFNFIPVMDEGGGSRLRNWFVFCGDYRWKTPAGQNEGVFAAFTGQNVGTTYGQIKLSTDFGSGSNWGFFASSSNNGVQKFVFPKTADNTSDGGNAPYYYHDVYWTYAFNGSTDDIIIAQSGGVYKNSISASNLVVRIDGKSGPAGSATPEVTTDFTSTFTGGLVNYFYLGEYMQLDCLEIGSTPQPNTNDIINTSQSGQIYATEGIVYNTQNFRFPLATATEWSIFDTWWRSSDRINNHIIVPFEDDTDMGEYYAKLSGYTINTRDKKVYDYSFNATEAK